ncbi:hypothetical protein D3C87_1079880 [compost metagenome]
MVRSPYEKPPGDKTTININGVDLGINLDEFIESVDVIGDIGTGSPTLRTFKKKSPIENARVPSESQRLPDISNVNSPPEIVPIVNVSSPFRFDSYNNMKSNDSNSYNANIRPDSYNANIRPDSYNGNMKSNDSNSYNGNMRPDSYSNSYNEGNVHNQRKVTPVQLKDIPQPNRIQTPKIQTIPVVAPRYSPLGGISHPHIMSPIMSQTEHLPYPSVSPRQNVKSENLHQTHSNESDIYPLKQKIYYKMTLKSYKTLENKLIKVKKGKAETPLNVHEDFVPQSDFLRRHELISKYIAIKDVYGKSIAFQPITDETSTSDLETVIAKYEVHAASMSKTKTYVMWMKRGFGAIEFIGKLLKMDFHGFYDEQAANMEQYEDLLFKISSKRSKGKKAEWSPESLLMLTIFLNAIIYIIIRLVYRYVPLAKVLGNQVSGAGREVSGFARQLISGEPAPDTKGTGLLDSLFSGNVGNIIGNFLGSGTNQTQAPTQTATGAPKKKGPSFEE